MSSRRTPAGALVRAVAARLVARVLDEHVAVDELLARATEVAERDQPLLAALVLGALRWHYRLEWQLARLLTRPLKKGETALGALLRLGLLQLQEMRIPPHAAVSATVDAVGLIGQARASPLVNAVLRRYQREHEALALEQERSPEARYAHPAWLIEAIRADWPDAWRAVLEANNAPPPLWLRVNLARTTRGAYLDRLAAQGLAAMAAADVDSAVRLDVPLPVDALPGFAAGEVSVQDLSAQRATQWLDLRPGQRILDACAAPGGKTGHILEACAGLAEVVALDRDPARLALVADNLARLGLSATLVAGDATAPSEWWDGRPFERILLDAPCSALGVVRRHPDIKVLRRAADVQRLARLQAELLRALWPLLAPGGRLVYATCTVLKSENAEQIAAFRSLEPTIEPTGATAHEWQVLPEEAGGDGFYYAWLHKSPVLRTPSGPPPYP